MGDLICEGCYYKGEKNEFEEHASYCKECLIEHAMCPKCGTPYHSATITEWNKTKHCIMTKTYFNRHHAQTAKQWRTR